MNLVKFKSVIMTTENHQYPSVWDGEQYVSILDDLIDTFNTYLKGKYCYYFHFTYAIPLGGDLGISDEQYIECEKTDIKPPAFKDCKTGELYQSIYARILIKNKKIK